MIGGILTAVAAPLLKGIFSVIDQSVEDKDQAAAIKAKLQEMVLTGQMKEIEAAAQIIVAEAQGESWLQRNWRPITMLSFLGLLFLYWFGIQPENMPESVLLAVFDLLKIGIGGYIVGRSVEKGVKVWKDHQ